MGAKRIFDILLAAVGLILLSPLFLLIAIWIKLSSSGPVFYKAKRVGKDGNLFYVLKFRSMTVDAAQLGPGITQSNDKRVTNTGRWLRKFKLDELPQLINVIKGEMSLVGPRPEDPRYVANYSSEQRVLLTVPPGITSPASIRYRNEESFLNGEDWEETYTQRILPEKLDIELNYLQKKTFTSDLKILWQTLWALFR